MCGGERSHGASLHRRRRRDLLSLLERQLRGGGVRAERILTSRQDNTLGLPGEIGELGGAGEHLSVNTEGSQAPEDQMASLAAKI